MRRKTSALLVLFFLVGSGCSSPNVAMDVSAESLATEEELEITITTPEILPTHTVTVTPQHTATADLRLPPEKWQDWPIIPEATNRTQEIYAKGVELGVNPHAFSKIGDCQNVKEAFMRIYDVEQYKLQDWQAGWQETIGQFRGYFDRDAKAFGQGLNVAAALSPLHADAAECLPVEGPIQCELRVANPAFAFIRFERWWEETPPDVYEKYLREIIEIVIDHGTVPILMNKADNIEGGHQINGIIAKLAYEYDIPMYNWWRAAQALPNRGMDPELNDGFHLDPAHAWTEQSAYALGTLDSIWKGVRGY